MQKKEKEVITSKTIEEVKKVLKSEAIVIASMFGKKKSNGGRSIALAVNGCNGAELMIISDHLKSEVVGLSPLEGYLYAFLGGIKKAKK